MQLIIITTPHFFDREAEAITALFHQGLEILHLRKPKASIEELERLLNQLPQEYLERIVTHERFSLVSTFHLKGIHLNARNPRVPIGYKGYISRSCHSFEEVTEHKKSCQYVFLSPIYNSISKEGYNATFSLEELKMASKQGVIDSQVMALGGICLEHLTEVKSLGFGGAVLLGDIWKHKGDSFINHFQEIKQIINP